MEPTLLDGDLVLVSRAAYARRTLERGDIVLMGLPGGGEYVKRVVGLPGDHIIVADGHVCVNSAPLDEPYAQTSTPQESSRDGSWVMGEVECFLLGDNRGDSFDSRAFGPVPLSWLRGRVWYRVKPSVTATDSSKGL